MTTAADVPALACVPRTTPPSCMPCEIPTPFRTAHPRTKGTTSHVERTAPQDGASAL